MRRSPVLHKLAFVIAAFVLALHWPLSATAEQSDFFGDYTVHYNALPTDVLQPAVARSYGITRSKNRVLLNVSALKKVMGTAANSYCSHSCV